MLIFFSTRFIRNPDLESSDFEKKKKTFLVILSHSPHTCSLLDPWPCHLYFLKQVQTKLTLFFAGPLRTVQLRPCTPPRPSPHSSPSPVRPWSVSWAGSRATRRRSGPRRPWTPWWRSWRRRKGPWRNWRKHWVARDRPQNVWPFHARLTGGYRCRTAKASLTSSTAACGAGLTYSLTTSWRPWTAVSSPSAPSRRTSASTHTTIDVLKLQVI